MRSVGQSLSGGIYCHGSLQYGLGEMALHKLLSTKCEAIGRPLEAVLFRALPVLEARLFPASIRVVVIRMMKNTREEPGPCLVAAPMLAAFLRTSSSPRSFNGIALIWLFFNECITPKRTDINDKYLAATESVATTTDHIYISTMNLLNSLSAQDAPAQRSLESHS